MSQLLPEPSVNAFQASRKQQSRVRRRSLCVPEVSQTGVLPHLVLCLPQMVGLGSSHVEDMTLIHRAFTWHSDTVLCNTSALLKVERRP